MIINQDIIIAAQFSTDGKGFKKLGNSHTAWLSTAEFLAAIPLTRRHNGMIAWITNGSDIELWHFVGGIADDKFVKFSLASVTSIDTETSISDFPAIGLADVIYIDATTKTPYIWDGSVYAVIGNPGPQGPKGNPGDQGPQGDTGPQGNPGTNGTNGDSAYQIAVDNGFVGTVTEWLASLKADSTLRAIRFKVGDGGADTPAADATSFTIAALVGFAVDDFAIWRNGTAIWPVDEYTFDSATGTVTLAKAGDKLTNGETFLIR